MRGPCKGQICPNNTHNREQKKCLLFQATECYPCLFHTIVAKTDITHNMMNNESFWDGRIDKIGLTMEQGQEQGWIVQWVQCYNTTILALQETHPGSIFSIPDCLPSIARNGS